MVSLPNNKNKQKQLAEESLKTKKAREKLQKRLLEMDAKMTKEALREKTKEIHQRISRHVDWRIALQSKEISLFDENQNAVDVSLKIAKLAERLQTGELPE